MKALPFKIPKKPHENVVLQIDKGQRFYDKLHQHEEIQLSYVIHGKGKLLVGNSVTAFGTGDFIALDANLPHVFLSEAGNSMSHMRSIFFTKESFGPNFFKNQEMQILEPFWESLSSGFKVVKDTEGIRTIFLELGNEDKFHLFIKLLQLLHYLTKVKGSSILEKGHTIKISKNQGQRLQVVFDYVMQNFQNEIQLNDVAEKIHMTKNAFCRFFKQRTNKTFFQFLAEIRIHHATLLLKEQPELSIAEIASLSGYPSISNFNHQFKVMVESSPNTYRKDLKSRI